MGLVAPIEFDVDVGRFMSVGLKMGIPSFAGARNTGWGVQSSELLQQPP